MLIAKQYARWYDRGRVVPHRRSAAIGHTLKIVPERRKNGKGFRKNFFAARRAAVQREETNALIERMFGGSSELFFSSFLRERGIGEEDTRELLRLIQEKGGEKR